MVGSSRTARGNQGTSTGSSPAGSNPYVEYKFKKDDCVTWEEGDNHSFTIDDTNPTYEIPWVDGWQYITPDCPGCATATEQTEWGTIKALYR